MSWIDTNTLIAICACAIGLTQFLLWKHISKTKAYIEEKAKLLAQEEKIGVLTTIAERAKNAVTKEDIGEITKQIETVKSGFAKEVEQLKSLLTIQSKAKTQLIYKQRKALEDFWSKYNIWHTSFTGGWTSCSHRIDIIQDLLNKANNNNHACVMALHNLSLYFDNNDFLENTRNLVYRTSVKLCEIERNIKIIQTINQNEQKGNLKDDSQRFGFLSEIDQQNTSLLQDEDINKLIEEFKAQAKVYILTV